MAVFSMLILSNAAAQCNINYDFGDADFGVSPDPTEGEGFNPGMLNEAYFDVLHILVPVNAAGVDPTLPEAVEVDSIKVEDGVNGPLNSALVFTDTTTMEEFYAGDIGLEVVLNNNGDSDVENTFLGGNQYCAAIQGVPSRAGVYRIAINVTAYADINGFPANLPYTFDDFLLRVNCPLLDSVNVVNVNTVDNTQGQLSVVLLDAIATDDINWYNDQGWLVGAGNSIDVSESGLYTLLITSENCTHELSGILVEDDGLDCNLSATVDVIPASEGEADGQATVNVTGNTVGYQVSWFNESGLLLGTEPFIEYLLSGVYSVVVTEDNGCTFEIDNVDATTNIPHHEGVSWGMFPNPASNVVTFTDIPVDGSWTLVTLDGRTVRTGRGGTSMTVDVSSLPSGMYVVRVGADNQWWDQKPLVLQHK